jgi:hypothetical protein
VHDHSWSDHNSESSNDEEESNDEEDDDEEEEEEDDDDDDEAEAEAQEERRAPAPTANPAPDQTVPFKLTINAATSIQGTNNLVPTSPAPLADASRFSTLLFHAIAQINAATDQSPQTGDPQRPPHGRHRRAIKVDLTINCGVTVIGDRNVVGNVGLKPRGLVTAPLPPVPAANPHVAAPAPAPVIADPAARTMAGAKRKAEAVGEDAPGDQTHPAKRVATMPTPVEVKVEPEAAISEPQA